LVLVDVDEVLGMFMRGFEAWVGRHGLEMRFDRYALFQNIFRPGESEHVDVEVGRDLLNQFFAGPVEHMDPVPGAVAALRELSRQGTVVILTNAPAHSREPRSRWLTKHGFDYPQVVNSGLKGPCVAALAARTLGRTAFIDDLLTNLDSVATAAPYVARFQLVADERMRAMAPAAPERHARIDDWDEMGKAIAAALQGE